MFDSLIFLSYSPENGSLIYLDAAFVPEGSDIGCKRVSGTFQSTRSNSLWRRLFRADTATSPWARSVVVQDQMPKRNGITVRVVLVRPSCPVSNLRQQNAGVSPVLEQARGGMGDSGAER